MPDWQAVEDNALSGFGGKPGNVPNSFTITDCSPATEAKEAQSRPVRESVKDGHAHLERDPEAQSADVFRVARSHAVRSKRAIKGQAVTVPCPPDARNLSTTLRQ